MTASAALPVEERLPRQNPTTLTYMFYIRGHVTLGLDPFHMEYLPDAIKKNEAYCQLLCRPLARQLADLNRFTQPPMTVRLSVCVNRIERCGH